MKRFGWDGGLPDLIKMSKTLDEHSVDSVLLPYGATDLDYFVGLSEMIRNSDGLRFMMAVRPYSISPEFLAKTFKTLSYYFRDRVTLNVVAGALSPEEEKFVLKNYINNVSDIDTIEKRIDLSDRWTERFLEIIGPARPEMYTITNSPKTVALANKYFDYGITSMENLDRNVGTLNPKMVVVIDPLIYDNKDDVVEYMYQPFDLEKGKGNLDVRTQRHPISGTIDEVCEQILDLSKKYGVDDFLIHTDQKDISKILEMISILTNKSLFDD